MSFLHPLPPAAEILLICLCATAAIFDIRWRRIPNWLCAAALIVSIFANTVLWHHGFSGLTLSLAGGGLALLIYLPLYAIRAMGAGDAKFMAALGALVGPSNWLFLFAATALAGGILALALTLARGKATRTLLNVGFLLSELASFRAPYVGREELSIKGQNSLTLPHAISIALGAACFLVLAHGVDR